MHAAILAATLLPGQVGSCPSPTCPPAAFVVAAPQPATAPPPARYGYYRAAGPDGVTRTYLGWFTPTAAAPAPSRPAAAPPARPASTPKPAARPDVGQVARGPSNFGLDTSRISLGGRVERYYASGPTAQGFVAEARGQGRDHAVGSGAHAQVDDSGKPHLTIIGSDDERAPVLRDMEPGGPLGDVRAAFLVQEYAPDEWPVASVGLPADGHPTIVVQDHAGGDTSLGRVVHRQSRYEGPGPLREALRRVNPAYDPARDPGPDGAASGRIEGWAFAGLAVLVLALALAGGRKE